MVSCSIIIPYYNEEKTVFQILQIVSVEIRTISSINWQIVAVDDGSTDGSLVEVQRFQKENPEDKITSVSSNTNRGKGAAIRRGLEAAKGDIILIQDADLEYNPGDYRVLVGPIERNLTNVVYGSRWIARDMHISGTIYTLGGWLENRFLHLFYRTNISDVATGYKVFRSEVLRNLDLQCEGFEFCPEVTAKLLNRKEFILEVPIRYLPRKKRDGKKIRWTDFLIALYTIFNIWSKRL